MITVFSAAKRGAAAVGAELSDQDLWALCFALQSPSPRYQGLQRLAVRIPELRSWLESASVEEGARYFAAGLRRVGLSGIAYVMHSSAFRAARAEAGEPPKEEPMSDKTETADKPDEPEEQPELKTQMLAWYQADELLAEETEPLARRVAQRQRDRAAEEIAALVDDDVLSDELILKSWPTIAAYARAVGWKQAELARFLSGPKKLIPIVTTSGAEAADDADADDAAADDADDDDADDDDADDENEAKAEADDDDELPKPSAQYQRTK